MGILDGPLRKWVNYVIGWEFRFFALDTELGILSYYLSKEHLREGKKKDSIYMKDAKIGIDDEDDCQFFIITKTKRLYLQARDSEERERWVSALEDAIRKQTLPLTSLDTKARAIVDAEADGFTRRIQEADVYLQMLIDQANDLDRRIRDEHTDPEALVSLKSVKTSADELIETVKQNILHLLIARHSTLQSASMAATIPSSLAVTSASGVAHSVVVSLHLPETLMVASPKKPSGLSPPTATAPLVSATSDADYFESDDDFFDAVGDSQSPVGLPLTLSGSGAEGVLGLLTTANSGAVGGENRRYSTEDERDPALSKGPFNNQSQSHIGNVVGLSSVAGDVSGVASSTTSNNNRRSASQLPVVLITDEQTEYDELYDDFYDDDDLESLDQHGSLIRHLLSQVRIGMDLTKVVLPTFILERRSLLEMFGDFFSHADLFVGIADQPTPRGRLVELVRWYLSAFHAGRRTQTAKKPYNPILGEVFRCYWKLVDGSSQTGPSESQASSGSTDTSGRHEGGRPGMFQAGMASDQQYEHGSSKHSDSLTRPIPWAPPNCLAFVAEQVSHHPPISAVYAEHDSKKITLDGFIWTKSKFLGLSIGVYMIGQSTVTCIEHEEQYNLTFPTAYGRSILTVPWIELGGKMTINCPKTGYWATVEFLTKPFYGGRPHQITAQLYDPENPRKPFMLIEGAWNSAMYTIKADGTKEVFIDTQAMPIIKKTVRPIHEQEEFESRRLWAQVTLNLKRRNVTKATDYKSTLEQKQREEAQYRKEHGIPWLPRYFDEADSQWIYRHPLISRTPPSSEGDIELGSIDACAKESAAIKGTAPTVAAVASDNGSTRDNFVPMA